jgi:hypothetical protein
LHENGFTKFYLRVAGTTSIVAVKLIHRELLIEVPLWGGALAVVFLKLRGII